MGAESRKRPHVLFKHSKRVAFVPSIIIRCADSSMTEVKSYQRDQIFKYDPTPRVTWRQVSVGAFGLMKRKVAEYDDGRKRWLLDLTQPRIEASGGTQQNIRRIIQYCQLFIIKRQIESPGPNPTIRRDGGRAGSHDLRHVDEEERCDSDSNGASISSSSDYSSSTTDDEDSVASDTKVQIIKIRLSNYCAEAPEKLWDYKFYNNVWLRT
ncbi:hypothetical protein CROQUDRAFT_676215 [Cronartium quercuum f. sp. fusiforme G11]|uniref:Uncharacterized protein n=1 Tax=Cronartium quercuum f. sp. fusiforme G11 TaxID=708437 RepID=A0A9P6THY4_9BASI|nr:hypothetical protein CROQUDRAFT_676215 [Cronartium quercuum f. sp. fusiforme G11]